MLRPDSRSKEPQAPVEITAEEGHALDTRGYAVLLDVLTPEQVLALRERVDELTREEGLSAGAVDQTPLQLWVNRRDLGPLGRLAALGHKGLFLLVHGIARAGLFRMKPELFLSLAGRAGSPGFARPRIGKRPKRSRTLLGRIRDELREMLAAAVYADPGAVRLSDLVNKGAVFDCCLTNERVLAAVRHVIGPAFRLSSLNYRAAKPGAGLQPLHVDWDEATEPGSFHACNCILLLDPFEQKNGALRVVPGTHHRGDRPTDVLADAFAARPDQVVVQAPAGAAIVLNSHVWHGGTRNQTSALRRVIQCYFVQPGYATQLEQRDYIRPETDRRLTPQLKALLDV